MKTIDQPLVTDVTLYLLNESQFYDDTRMLRENYLKRIAKQCYIESLAVKGLDCHIQSALKSKYFAQYYSPGIRLNPEERKLVATEILSYWFSDELAETPQPSEDEIKAKIKRVKAMINRGAKFVPIGS